MPGMEARPLHVLFQQLDNLVFTQLEIFRANLRRDRESRRDRNPDQVHLREVGAFATQQVTHVRAAFRLAIAKSVNSFSFHFYRFI